MKHSPSRLIAPFAFCVACLGGSVFGGDDNQQAATANSRPTFRQAAYLQQAQPKGRSTGVHWTFNDIDVQTLLSRLKQFGVEVPVEVAGRVSVRLSLAAPWRSLLRPSAYEIEGDLSSDSLTVAGFELRKVSLHLVYTGGELQLTKMTFAVPGKDGRDGAVSGTARVPLRPRGDLTAQLSIDRIPLATFFDTLPGLAGRAGGTAAGQFSGRAPVDRVRDGSAWQAQGRLTLTDVRGFGLPPARATADFRLANGRAAITDLSAQLERAAVTGSGALTLAAPYAFTARLRAAVPDLAWLKQLDAALRPPFAVGGSFTLTAEASGALQPKQVTVRGALTGRDLKLDNLAIDRLRVPYESTLDRIRLNAIRLDLYGGQILANLALPTDRAGQVGVGLKVQNIDLGRLASAALGQRRPGRGRASGTAQLQAPAARLQDLSAWAGRGQLSLADGNLLGVDVSRIAANVRVEAGRLIADPLTLDSPLAQVSGSIQADLTAPFGFGAALRMANVDFAQLNRLPEGVRPPVTVGGRAGISTRLQGTLSPMSVTARGGAATRRLSVDGIVVESLDFDYRLKSPDDPRELENWEAQIDARLAGVRIDRLRLSSGKLTARLAEGTLNVSQLAIQSGAMRIDGSARLAAASPHEFGLKLKVVDADLSLVNRLPAALRPPAQVAGVVSASADVQGRLEPLQLEGGGDFSGRRLRVGGALIDTLGFAFSADGDHLTLSRLAATAYRGRVDGQLQIPLAEAAAGDVDLRWQRLNLGRLLSDLSGPLATRASSGDDGEDESPSLFKQLAESRFEGWTWGRVTAQTPAGKLLDPASWTGDLDVSLAAVRVFGWSARQAFLRGRLADGQAELTRLAFDLNGARLRGTAALKLTRPYDFKSQISLTHLRLADVNELPEALRPPIDLAGDVTASVDARGTLDPLEITGQGSVAGEQIEADGARVDRLAIDFSAEKTMVELTRFRADLYGGRIDGTASLALDGAATGKAAFAWQDVDLGQLATDVARPPVRLQGKVSGQLDLDIPGGKLADVSAWTVNASFETSPLTADLASLGQLSGRIAYQRGILDYDVRGGLLRGTIELAGRWQPRPPPQAAAVNEGHFEIAAARLDALTPLLRSHGDFDSLTGELNLDVRYRHDEQSGAPLGSGEVALDDLRLDGAALLGGVRGVLRLVADRFEVANLDGAFAGGAFSASAVVFFDPARRGTFRASINGAEIAQALMPWPSTAARVRGTLDAQLQGFFGGRRPAQVQGALGIRRGQIYGIELGSARLPFSGRFDPVSGIAALQARGVSAHLARGRLSGNADLTWANGLDLKGRGKFSRLDLRTLLRNSASASRLASGKIEGDFSLAGRNVRTIADLTGTLDADLTDTQAMALPVLQRTLPYLTGGVSGSTNFDQGTLRAHLSRGVMRIERFSLTSGSVQIYARGNVSLSGRLGLNVTAKTGQLNARLRAISLLATRVALIAAPPIGLMLEATQFLSNQVINLEVTGTIRSPTIRVRPLQLLGREAAQFFLWQALP